jgi:hypothetical protein
MSDYYDLRGKQGGVERQDVNMQAITWADMPGMAGIDKPGSPVAKVFMGLGEAKGMVGVTLPKDDVKYRAAGALGAFGLSALHRVQWIHGHELSLPVGGSLQPSVPNPEAHPALQSKEGFFFTLGADRPVKAAEQAKVAGYAPEAKTEHDLMVAGGRYVLQGRKYTETRYDLGNPGYATEGDVGASVVVQEEKGGNVVMKHYFAPTPKTAERNRAQTQHTYTLLRNQLGSEMNGDKPLLNVDDHVLVGTNSIYVPFQSNAATDQLRMRAGWHTDLTAFSADMGGINRQAVQLLPEIRSDIRHLTMLGDSILAASQHPEAARR